MELNTIIFVIYIRIINIMIYMYTILLPVFYMCESETIDYQLFHIWYYEFFSELHIVFFLCYFVI